MLHWRRLSPRLLIGVAQNVFIACADFFCYKRLRLQFRPWLVTLIALACHRLFVASLPLLLIGSEAAAQFAVPIRINAGGGSYTDGLGQTWTADAQFVGGQTYVSGNAIAGTTNDTLYQSERYGTFGYQIPLATGVYEVTLHFAEIYWSGIGQRVFDVSLESGVVLDNFDIVQAAGGSNTAVTRTFSLAVSDGTLNINFSTVVDNAKVSAIEVKPEPHPGHPYLHVVIQAPAYLVDYDGNGTQVVPLDGTGSHTHEPGRTLTAWNWHEGSVSLGTGPNIAPALSVGAHNITLTIADDKTPPDTLQGSTLINIYPINAVGGVLATYHPGGTLDAPGAVGFQEIRSTLRLEGVGNKIGGSPYTGNVIVIMKGVLQVSTAASYAFQVTGGSGGRLHIDGTLVTGPRSLAAGSHSIEFRLAVSSVSVLPAELVVSIDGGSVAPVAAGQISHDETNLAPFLNALTPGSGAQAGGEPVTISGVGFFKTGSGAVSVNWGGTILSGAALAINATGSSISLLTPAGTGTVSVSAQTSNGTSNTLSFSYLTGTATVNFQTSSIQGATPFLPTQSKLGTRRSTLCWVRHRNDRYLYFR